jgi:hypothetical protein
MIDFLWLSAKQRSSSAGERQAEPQIGAKHRFVVVEETTLGLYPGGKLESLRRSQAQTININ